MPLFYFDTDDGTCLVRDTEGMEFTSEAPARQQALIALADKLREHVEDGGRRLLLVAVRDQDGAVIYRATVRLKGEWVQSRVE